MVSKREERRQAFRDELVAAAGRRIEAGGLAGLRARDLASDVGCALGGIYTAFPDLDALILQVNAETLDRLDAALAGAAGGRGPREALAALAEAYAGFAAGNRNRWDALFDHRMAGGAPDWLLARHAALLGRVTAPLGALLPGLPEEELEVRARTYFAAVHGIVTISLQRRFLGLPEDSLLPELRRFVGYVVEGSIGAPV